MDCWKPALKDKGFCKKHYKQQSGAGDSLRFRGGPQDVYGSVYRKAYTPEFKEKMGFFYKHLGPKLKTLFDEAVTVKEFDIQEEITLTRIAATEQLAICNQLHAIWDDPSTRPTEPQAVSAYAALLREATEAFKKSLSDITYQVERQAKIHAMVAEKLGPNAIADVVRQINRMIYETFGQSDWEGVKRLNDRLTNELQLPSLKNQGTTITPDQEVMLMDASVPLFVETIEPIT